MRIVSEHQLSRRERAMGEQIENRAAPTPSLACNLLAIWSYDDGKECFFNFHHVTCPFSRSYLKYLISDTCEWSIAAQCAYLKYINAPNVNIVEHCTECWLVCRFDAIDRKLVAREGIGMHEWTFKSRYLRHCSR